jgi:hypothetical protein
MFLLVADDENKRFLNLNQIAWAELTNEALTLHMSDSVSFSITGKGATEVARLIAKHTILSNGQNLLDMMDGSSNQ